MKLFWYDRRIKIASHFLTGLLAGLLVLCFSTIDRKMEHHISPREMRLSFENTDTFLETVYQIVMEKINYDQNLVLFEVNGDFNDNRLVDVHQYVSGQLDETTANQNTTYSLMNLLQFAQMPDGAAALKARIEELITSEASEAAAGERLAQESDRWEQILPVSGISLQETTRRIAGGDGMLVQYYRDLCESSMDIQRRYLQYLDKDNELKHSDAPSNVGYYIENTATKQSYSNLSSVSLAAAQEAARTQHLTPLFAGERRMNIMVSDPDYYYSDVVSQYFMQTRFGGSGERIFLAVDSRYAVGDRLHSAYVQFQQREPVIIASLILAVLAGLFLIGLTVVSVIVSGQQEKGSEVSLTVFDEVPTEIAAGTSIVLIITWGVLAAGLYRYFGTSELLRTMFLFLAIAIEYELCLAALLSLDRRIKAHVLWKNSVCYYVMLGTRQVYRARKSSQRLLIMYIGYIVLNILFVLLGGISGLIMGLVVNFAVLLYLMRDVVGNQTIQEGLQQISEGKLDYRINVQALYGESREIGRAVNEMGEGLEKAVESMLQGERLKAELITNVSHDLKTPLTSIINYVDLLKRQNPQDEKTREYLEILETKTRRLREMTEDLIEVSKLSSGNVELHPAKLSLQEFVWQAEGEFEDALSEAQLQLKIIMPQKKLFLYVDGAKLWRIFENLLGNAVKYAAAGTEVTLRAVILEDQQVQITFENIAKQEITVSAAHLKERFSRGDESRSTEGFGLGLSIAGNLTSAMGGTFDVLVQGRNFTAALTFPQCSED